jgi:hypothetical protein
MASVFAGGKPLWWRWQGLLVRLRLLAGGPLRRTSARSDEVIDEPPRCVPTVY